MENTILRRTLLRRHFRLFLLLVLAAVILVGAASCKPFDYPVRQLLLDVTYTGNWTISLRPGEAAVPYVDAQNLILDESDGPYSIIIIKDATTDTLTATLTLKTVWINGETGAEITSPPVELVVVEQQTNSSANGSLNISY